MEFADPVWSTLGAHDGLMGDKLTDFKKTEHTTPIWRITRKIA